jgi:type III restriction enzyme
VKQYRRFIAIKIYEQMKEHFCLSEPEYIEPKVLPFVAIKDWHFTALSGYGYKDFRDAVNPVNTVTKYVYRGFERSCHIEYKFDSKTEKDFSCILESDKTIIKWLRPEDNQFRLYWANNSKLYHPYFVAETADCFYIIETKAENEMNSEDVASKKEAALRYCKYASAFTTSNGGKPWKYLLIPHNEVKITSSFEFFVNQYTATNN